MTSLRLGSLVLAALWLASCGNSAVDKANEALAMGDGPRAAREFARALDDSPSDTALRRGLGEALILVARQKALDGEDLPADWSSARRELEHASRDSSVRELLDEASLSWARAALRKGDTALAVTGLEGRMESAEGTRRERNLLAILMDHQGQREKASELFLENARQDSTDADAWFNLAMVERARGLRIEAAEHLLQAAKHAPDDPEILFWLERVVEKDPKR